MNGRIGGSGGVKAAAWMETGEIRFPSIGDEKRSDSRFDVGEDGGGVLHHANAKMKV